ncbi:hypothetical protein LXL04_034132 [Taraxacum kok-saghyz]
MTQYSKVRYEKATKFKVHSPISLTTRPHSGFLVNPPVEQALQLRLIATEVKYRNYFPSETIDEMISFCSIQLRKI